MVLDCTVFNLAPLLELQALALRSSQILLLSQALGSLKVRAKVTVVAQLLTVSIVLGFGVDFLASA